MRILERLGRPIPLIGLLALGLLELRAARSAADDDGPRSPSSGSAQYTTSEIEGWTVHVKKDFQTRQPALAERTLTVPRSIRRS